MTQAKKINQRVLSFFIAFILLSTVGASNAYAAGVETFRLNNSYFVGSFTFTCDNTTPTKTVQGRYLRTYLTMKRSPSDKGVATTWIRVTVKVLDASTLKQIGTTKTYLVPPEGSVSAPFEVDLGYAGRKIAYRFDSYSYNGPTNAYYRTVYVSNFTVNTSNTKGQYTG